MDTLTRCCLLSEFIIFNVDVSNIVPAIEVRMSSSAAQI